MARNYQEKIFTDFDKQTVEYIPASVGGVCREVNIYLPRGNKLKRIPFIIWLHGGGGDMDQGKDWLGGEWCPRGYGGAAPDYADVGDGSGFTMDKQVAAIINVAALIGFLIANHADYGVAVHKIIVTGTSAGGDTAVGLNAVLDRIMTDPMFASPVNALYPKAERRILCTATHPGACNPIFRKFIGCENVPDHAHHGVLDDKMPIQEARVTLKKFDAQDVPSTLVEYPGADHKLAGLKSTIASDLAIKFAGLMGIPPIAIAENVAFSGSSHG